MGFVILGFVLLGLTVYYLLTTMNEMKIKKGAKEVEEGNLDTALNIFMESLRRDPENIEALWHLGNINEEKQNYLESIGYYNHLIEIGKECKLFTMFELYRRTGILYRKIDRDKEALDYLMQAYQLLPSSRDVLKNLAMIIYSQKQYYRAMPFFEKAVALIRDDNKLLRHYGLCLVMVDNISESVGVLEEVIRNYPDDHDAKFILAYVYMKMGAWQKARELIEEVANAEDVILSKDQMYYAIKMLFLSYTMDRNYEVARELHKKLENMFIDQQSVPQKIKDDIVFAFIFLRLKQGYYDLALEKFNQILEVGIDTTGMSEDNIRRVKENQSFLFSHLSSLDAYKKERDRINENPSLTGKVDIAYNKAESEAKDAKAQLDKFFDEWMKNFLEVQSIWTFFSPHVQSQFDPSTILDKYSEENMKVMKDKFKNVKVQAAHINPFKTLGIDPSDVCNSMMNIDFPSFVMACKELAEAMGFRVINQAIKIDPSAYSEGQGCEMLCEEKSDRETRVIFAMRRWRQQTGIITIQNMLSSMKEYRAQRVVFIATTTMTDEARAVVEKEPRVSYYYCDEIASFMM